MGSFSWSRPELVFALPDERPSWMAHHAAVPVPWLSDGHLRVFFAARDEDNRSRVAFVDVDPRQPSRVLGLSDHPALDLGDLGTFDDSGVMPSSLIERDGELWLYYTGWNRTMTVPYRNAIGLAVSTDGGVTFERAHRGPILDRDVDEPYFTTTPFVARRGSGPWQMWYASGTGWIDRNDPPTPLYVIKYAESDDGIDWHRPGVTCIEPLQPEEANVRPWVMADGARLLMWFCYRGSSAFRSDPGQGYRLGCAESADGRTWVRFDDHIGPARSAGGADADMQAYPAVYVYEGRTHLLFNGNGFGASGILHAVST